MLDLPHRVAQHDALLPMLITSNRILHHSLHSYAAPFAMQTQSLHRPDTRPTFPPSPHISNPHSAPQLSAHLRIRKVHLGVTLFELLQDIQLALLVARRFPHLLLPLVIHHLLDHAARLAVQVTQLAVLGLDLGRVEEVGGVVRDRGPPLLLVRFVEVDGDFFTRGGGLERPGGFGGADLVGKGTL